MGTDRRRRLRDGGDGQVELSIGILVQIDETSYPVQFLENSGQLRLQEFGQVEGIYVCRLVV